MPFSSISVPLVDFLIGLVLFIPLYWQYHFVPSWQVFFAPLFLILAIVSAFGLGLIFAVFNVQYRDFGQIIPFLVQFGFFACPVAFSTYAIQNESWYQYYNYIPVVGIIDGFRWSMLGGAAELKWQSLIPAIVFALIVNVIAVYLFRKKENTFVDYI
jgi:lipopolysaccharide transport system permease protein